MEDEKVVYWKDVEKKIKFEQAKAKAKDTIKKGVDWVKDNKELCIAGIPLLIEGSRLTRKLIDKGTASRKEHYIYDPSLHQNLRLKRKLTGAEQAEISRRHSKGEKLSDIYRSMNILK